MECPLGDTDYNSSHDINICLECKLTMCILDLPVRHGKAVPKEVVKAVTDLHRMGFGYREIANMLDMSPRTVERYIKRGN